MRADKWSFRAVSFVFALVPTSILFYFFHESVHPLWFLVPMYWFMYIRDTRSRMRELNSRISLACDMMAMSTQVDDPYDMYESLLDRHGFYDDAENLDEWDRL